jgi:signal transduction histidine kinase
VGERRQDRSIAIVSHELRGPINIVLGWTFTGRRLDDHQRDKASIIERNALTQASLVEGLGRPRIASGRLEWRASRWTCAGAGAVHVDAVAPAAETKEFACIGDPAAPRGERIAFPEVLMNLLSNALKFAKAGRDRCT